jgi:3,5-epimerase/4-reductase
MRILIYGHKGWIGGMLINEWKERYPEDELIFGEARVEYQNKAGVLSEITLSNPDRIVCLLGRTSGKIGDRHIPNIDYLEEKGKLYENVRDNLFAPLLLAIISNRLKIHLTYVGTGCIFSRNTRENDYIYTEEDFPDFSGSSYSAVKGYTDQLMPMFENVLNVRIRMPITSDYKDPKSFVSKIIGFERIYSMPNSMTYLPDMIPLLIRLSMMKETGTIHLVNKGGISHSNILNLYKEKIDNNHTFEEINGEELERLLKAPRSNNILSTERLEKLFPGEVRDIRECIEEIFK